MPRPFTGPVRGLNASLSEEATENMYSGFLLHTGGGIIPASQRINRDTHSAHIIIGLGGSGINCIRRIKTNVYDTLKPDNPEDSIPVYSNIRFMGIDSDSHNRNYQQDLFQDDEFVFLEIRYLEGMIHTRIQDSVYSWFNKDIHTFYNLSTHLDSAAIRQIGRFLFFNQVTRFMQLLEKNIREARMSIDTDNINIYIITSLCGGTGSGCFLDVCYLTREMLRRMGLSARIHGFFFMPEIILDRISHEQGSGRKLLMANGYASLQELDYCMSLPENGGSFEQSYPDNYTALWDRPPVDLCYLVDAMNLDGEQVPDAYRNAMETVSGYIFRAFTTDASANNLVPISERVYDSLNGPIHYMRSENGAKNRYAAIGVSKAGMSLKEATTYLAAKVFEESRNIINKKPNFREINEFAEKSKITYDDILNEIGNGMPYLSCSPDDENELCAQISDIMHDKTPSVLKKKNRQLSCIKEHNKAVKEALLSYQETTGYYESSSLCGRVRKALTECCIQPGNGPFYAERILNNPQSTPSLMVLVESYIYDNTIRLDQLKSQLGLFEEKMETAKEKLRNSMILTRRKKVRDYLYAVDDYYYHLAKMEILQTADEVLRGFRTQLKALDTELFIRLTRLLNELDQTFTDNRNYLTDLADPGNRYSRAALELVPFKDLAESLEQVYNTQVGKDAFYIFVKYLLFHPELLKIQDENRICKIVADYFGELSDYAQWSISFCLNNMFGTTGATSPQNKIYPVLKMLEDRALPLIVLNEGNNHNGICQFEFLSIPNNEMAIQTTAAAFRSNKNGSVDIVNSEEKNNVTYIRIISGFTITSLNWVGHLGKIMEQQYKFPGVHIYEESPDVPTLRDWRRLPSIDSFYSCTDISGSGH